ncbi:hypothetical protein SAMN02982931_01019 [Bauldia litoralis]|uniref:Transmembrane protein n=1 Tax=Bauldia litoralis TaxID=665467 RepID=A0A1G6AZ61_9HYPH|nr:hypothetical protein SAMN02982931_01019 [Bauldia litoralis]
MGKGTIVQRPILANITALAAALVVIIAVSALWIVNLRMGPPLEAFTGGAMVIYLPAMLLILTVLWVVLRALFVGGRALAVWMPFVGGAVLALIVVVANCGPTRCFVPGNERLLGWFAVGGAGLAALTHHLVLRRFAGEANAT